ncbi:hypothetical protein Tsp_03311 [Trichinella spiralis]|uniref:hypothetical protein n=1 Tax=Trichinella spiralis TaxID=6334 RepID=UPI0001EFC7C9|nr:hypothetical protein Tsp_03311 [Trichinella spiralis]
MVVYAKCVCDIEGGGGEKVEVLTKCFTAAHAVFRSTGDGSSSSSYYYYVHNLYNITILLTLGQMLLRLQWLKSYSRSGIVDDFSLDEERYVNLLLYKLSKFEFSMNRTTVFRVVMNFMVNQRRR